MKLSKYKIAIVCDWLTSSGGAEKVVYALHQLFPDSPIYTSVYDSERLPEFKDCNVKPSWLQKIKLARKKHQYFLNFYPEIFENIDLSEYDIVISSSHSCAKGIITGPNTVHISYCHSPMRYAWDNNSQYISEYKASWLLKKFAKLFIHKLRLWDKISADRVDYFISNSKFIQKRIRKFYRKEAHVIYPFIEHKNFFLGEKSDYYLAVGRITSYKKFDLIVEAFNLNGKKIKIVGTGDKLKILQKKAKSNVEFLGFVSDSELKKLYSQAKALIFPQIEDFGIVPIEAMASGTPVIAFKAGGAKETVIDKKTGIFFEQQTAESINNAIDQFENTNFNKETIRKEVEKFDLKYFQKNILEFIESKLN